MDHALQLPQTVLAQQAQDNRNCIQTAFFMHSSLVCGKQIAAAVWQTLKKIPFVSVENVLLFRFFSKVCEQNNDRRLSKHTASRCCFFFFCWRSHRILLVAMSALDLD